MVNGGRPTLDAVPRVDGDGLHVRRRIRSARTTSAATTSRSRGAVAQQSLIIAVTVGIWPRLGATLGALAGFYPRSTDNVLMRFVESAARSRCCSSRPSSAGDANDIPVSTSRTASSCWPCSSPWCSWLDISRLVTVVEFLSLREKEYVEAARAIGCSNWRIIRKHLVPNSIQPVIVYSTLGIGTAILSEAALSFLGVGALEPTPSWGLMIQSGRASGVLRGSPHHPLLPCPVPRDRADDRRSPRWATACATPSTRS